MKKKYLSKTSVTDNRGVVEYTFLAGLENFYIIVSSQRDSRRLTIPYTDLNYPQFISEEAILEELEEKIRKFFEEESEGKVNLLCYSAVEELRIKQIIIDNKREFEL